MGSTTSDFHFPASLVEKCEKESVKALGFYEIKELQKCCIYCSAVKYDTSTEGEWWIPRDYGLIRRNVLGWRRGGREGVT